MGFEARRVVQGNFNASAFSDPIANTEKVIASLWCKSDGSTFQRRALRRPL
jgi:hypothetical protein